MSEIIQLWDDVPQEQRIDEDFLKDCGGYWQDLWGHEEYFDYSLGVKPFPEALRDAPKPQGDKWLQTWLQRIANPPCHKACKWGDRYAPCALQAAPGERFCYRHGGQRKPKPAPGDPKPRPKDPLKPHFAAVRRAARAIQFAYPDLAKQLMAIGLTRGQGKE